MAQVMKMRWEGIAPEQYDQLREVVSIETQPPDGLISHAVWFREGGMVIMDVWESSSQFDDFMQSRLAPAIAQIGVEGQPETKWIDAHAVFIPAVHTAATV